MKTYTDGKTTVQAKHKAEAFDMLQDIYGNSDIGPIGEVHTFKGVPFVTFNTVEEAKAAAVKKGNYEQK